MHDPDFADPEPPPFYLCPTGWGAARDTACIGGTGPAFSRVAVLRRAAPTVNLAVGDVPDALGPVGARMLRAITAPRAPLAGLTLNQPRVMGIVNVTPDSFSDGGVRFDAGRAVADGLAMRAAGADIIDIGGESTRPGAAPVPVDEELRRVVPVVAALAAQGVLVSIDTRRAPVMRAALAAGARMLNDVSALTDSADSLAVAAQSDVPVVLMHMRGAPQTMQDDPVYADVALDVYDYLAARIAACTAAGIDRGRLVVDPGIGFGKTLQHNLRLLAHTAMLHALGCPVLIGVSRKRFIAGIDAQEGRAAGGVQQRLGGSLAAALDSLYQGAQILRVHDVAETVQAVAVWRALGECRP
jgi:dihydropteroate synthase